MSITIPLLTLLAFCATYAAHLPHSHTRIATGSPHEAGSLLAVHSFMCGYTHCPEESHNHGKDSHEKPCLLCKKNLPGTGMPSGVSIGIVLPQVLSVISFEADHFSWAQLPAPRSRGPPVDSDSHRV